jgi:hypothetical protein
MGTMREQVAGLLHRAGLLGVAMRLRHFTPIPTLGIVTYHHIQDHSPEYSFDPSVADATPEQFRRQMVTLARYCTPIGIADLVRAVEGEPLPDNAVMVTFDDGYRSCHDVALPILREVGVRATFFISTAFVSERKLYWWERIALLFSLTGRERTTLEYPEAIAIEVRDPASRNESVSASSGLPRSRPTTPIG